MLAFGGNAHLLHMKLLKRACKKNGLGGHPPEGWLPPQSATPLPTRQIDLHIEIASDSAGGYFLLSHGPDDESLSDTWHSSLEDALDQAFVQFGVRADEWADVV